MPNSIKIYPAEAELFYADEQMDATNLIVTFAGGLSGLRKLAIDRWSLPLSCTFVAPRDGRTIGHFSQPGVKEPWIWCQWFAS
jgi:hypothetical protein